MSLEANGQLIPSGGGDAIPLIRDTLILGRRESCDICLRFPNVSSRHCELQFHDGFWYIRDLNSTNGVKVNGSRVQRKLVHPGDEITIAKRRYTIQYSPPMAGQRALEELEDDILSQSLLERAGLERPKPGQGDKGGSKGLDPADFLLEDDE
jgi:adenylate cyclase